MGAVDIWGDVVVGPIELLPGLCIKQAQTALSTSVLPYILGYKSHGSISHTLLFETKLKILTLTQVSLNISRTLNNTTNTVHGSYLLLISS